MSDDKVILSEQQKIILDNMARDMGSHGEWCFYVAPGQETETYGEYIPAMVFQEVQSYFSMNGPLYGDVPFILGKNLTEAKMLCKLMNKHIGLDDEQVEKILASAKLGID